LLRQDAEGFGDARFGGGRVFVLGAGNGLHVDLVSFGQRVQGQALAVQGGQDFVPEPVGGGGFLHGRLA